MSDRAAGRALGPDDRAALRALVDGYAVAVDRRDVAGFVALFTDDGTLATFGPDGRRRSAYHGRDELAAIPPALARYERTLHLVSTHLVEGSPALPAGDEAAGTAYCEAHHHLPAADAVDTGAGTTDRVLFIRYDDRYARRGPGWRIRAREVHVVWQEERALP